MSSQLLPSRNSSNFSLFHFSRRIRIQLDGQFQLAGSMASFDIGSGAIIAVVNEVANQRDG